MSDVAQPDEKKLDTTVGRTPWDAGAILLLVLGRAVPYVTILAIAVYAIIEVSRANNRARVAAIEEYATRIENLIALQESGFQQYEGLRTGQIDTLEKLSTLTNGLITSTGESLTAISDMQSKIEAENAKLAQAQSEIEATRRNLESQSQRADELDQLLIGAEARLDLAYRITEYVVSGGLDQTPPLSRTALSEIFEGSAPGAVRAHASGERFYGIYRITATEMHNFIAYCERKFPIIFATLQEAGGQDAAREGSDAFRSVWAGLSSNQDFRAAQEDYVREEFYVPFKNLLEAQLMARFPDQETKTALDFAAVEAVIWSTAVQHALRKDMIASVVSQFEEPPEAEAFINAVYDERGRVDYYFYEEPPELRRVLQARYVFERRAALDMLAAESRRTQEGSTE